MAPLKDDVERRCRKKALVKGVEVVDGGRRFKLDLDCGHFVIRPNKHKGRAPAAVYCEKCGRFRW